MDRTSDTWTQEHDLALVYLSLAYGSDEELSDYELATITDVLQGWRTDFPPDEVQEVVMEAVTVYLEDNAHAEVVEAIEKLGDQLSEENRRRALADVVRIAEADGVLLSDERNLISTLAEQWGIKNDGQKLLSRSRAPVRENTSWTLLHDIALMYLVMAHSTDNELAETEITAMIDRLGDWQSSLDEDAVRKVLREALTFYSQEPSQEAFQESVAAIRDHLPAVQRLALLDDLMQIGQSDGAMQASEREMLSTMSRAWGVSVRV